MEEQEERDVYIERQEAAIRDVEDEIKKLRGRVDKAKADAKSEYLEQAEGLKRKLREAKERLRELNAGAEDAWQEMRSGVDSSMSDLRASMKAAREKLRGV
jgi:DNA repair exonuclease SbcCD ATPase subunit